MAVRTAPRTPAGTVAPARRRAAAALRRVPRAAWACAAVAFVNCAIWAVLVPPFHVPDETVHFAYTQYLAETGKLPTHAPGPAFSTEQRALLDALKFDAVIGNANDNSVWSDVEQKRLEQANRQGRRDDGGFKTVATNQPPLYYALEAIAYRAVPGTGTLTRLYAMRMMSALMAAATVLFVFLFLRELLPRTPFVWTVGALAVALQPMFAFEGGGVNNDNLLYLGVAALFAALARAFRRGLTPRRAAAIGGALAVALLAKLTALAFVPAAALALLWLGWRAWRADGVAPRQVVRSLATAGVVVAVPLLLYVVLNTTVFDRPLFQGSADGAVVVAANPNAKQPILNEQLSYTWQLFLPRLPFMNNSFVGTKPIWDTWFMGLNGRFGVLDYSFSPDFNRFALWAVFIPILLLAGVGLWRSRAVLRSRLPELAVYLAGVVGLMLAIGKPSYEQWVANDPFPFYQPRYILVLLPLYAAIAALAVRGAGRRLGPAVGAGIVMLALAHTFFAQLLTIERFYT